MFSSSVPPKTTSYVNVTLPLYAKIVVVLFTAHYYTLNQILVLQETIDRTAGRSQEHSRCTDICSNRLDGKVYVTDGDNTRKQLKAYVILDEKRHKPLAEPNSFGVKVIQ